MDSDDDLCLVESLDEAERRGSDILLFARPDGYPMAFVNLDHDFKTTEIIEAHGGIVVDRNQDIFKRNTIKVCSKDSTYDSSEDIFDKLFIYDSLRENKIGNLDDYRLSRSVEDDEVENDPTDILLGYDVWTYKKPFVDVEEKDNECLPSSVEIKENNETYDYCDIKQKEPLKTEDELWEAREPYQVYVSQDPEVRVGTQMMENQPSDFEDTLSQHISQSPYTPEFVEGLLHRNII